MIFEKHRFEIWNITQHPYKHRLSDFGYFNNALPNVTNVQSALDYIVAVLYPNTQPNVPTPADLPTGIDTPNIGDVTPSLNDYRVVDDDGDGKSAGYRWEQREGEVAPSWHKIFDVDWSTDAILTAVQDVTDDRYMFSKGKDDLDAGGVAVAGLYAGQKVFGGASSGTNLTLNANAADGVGAQTGFVQVDSQFRPTIDDTFDLSTATERWRNAWFSGTVTVGPASLVLTAGSITDTSGQISFDNENLLTTGNITGGVITGTSLVADDTTDTVTLVPGSYTDTTGAVDFGTANLLTTGTLGAGVATFTDATHTVVIDPNIGGNRASITASRGTIDFDDENLVTTGTLEVGAITGTQLDIDNIRIDGNSISSTDVNGNIILVPNGTGIVDVQKTLQTLDQNLTGTLTVTGQADIDDLTINGSTISNNQANGSIILSPSGTGLVEFSASLLPTSDDALDIGSATNRVRDAYLSGKITDGTDEIVISTLLAFRSGIWRDLAQTIPAQAGDALFYDAVNGVWLASTPDSEVDHTTIANLTTGDAGHTQFVMLAGRAGGQTIQGGTAASENLVLESTSNVTKGYVLFRDVLAPFANANFSGSWSGTDIGDGTHYFRNVYTKGEFFGFRLENVASPPAASAQNIGRLVFSLANNRAYVDIGTEYRQLGGGRYVFDTVWDGIITVLNVDVSGYIDDARNAGWQIKDNANNFEIMYLKIEATSDSNVRITSNVPLPAGSYRLVGLE